MGFDHYRCVPTLYFRFQNYQNTDVVFIPENTVPLSFLMKKNMKVKVVEPFADHFRPFSSLSAARSSGWRAGAGLNR